MVDGFAHWEITTAGALVIGIIAVALLLAGLICGVHALHTFRDKPGQALKWTWISILMSVLVLAEFAGALAWAGTYPKAMLIEAAIGSTAAEILIAVMCFGTALAVSRHQYNFSKQWIGYVLAWAFGAVIVIAGCLPTLTRWANTFFGLDLSVAMWALAFLCCLGAAGVGWHVMARRGQEARRSSKIPIVGVALLTGCAGLFVTLYQVQGEHDDDLEVRFMDRLHQGVEFLDSDDSAVRSAGLQQLASVADDYSRHPELSSWLTGRDSAIDVIQAYVKTPFNPTAESVGSGSAQTGSGSAPTESGSASAESGSEQSVRAEVSRILHDHLDFSSGGACESVASIKPADDGDYKGRTGKGVPTEQTQDDPNSPADETLHSGSARSPEPTTGEEAQCWAGHRFDFSDAYFWQADFSHALFTTDIDFSRAWFFGTTDFSSMVAEQSATFAGAQFAPYDQVGTSTSGWAGFDDAVFRGQTDFSSAVFGTHSPQTSEPVSDDWDVSFVGTHFDGDLSFHGADFLGSVTFDQAEFSSLCYVDSDGKKNIGEGDYDRLCNDDHPEWDNADFTDASFAEECGDQCRKGTDVEFTNAIFYSTSVFTGAASTVLPEFWQAQFWDDAWLDIDLTTPATTWCVPLSDDMASSIQNCWPTSSGTPWYTRVTLGPSVTVYLDHQAGHEGRCRVNSESSAERTKDADLTCS